MSNKVGFVGVGLMGHGMARNLVEKGNELVVLARRKREAVEDLKTRGATEAANLAELAQSCDRVVLCVTGSTQVEEILLGPDGLAAAGREMLVIDCSTSDPTATRRLAATVAPHGIALVDAPLARSPKEAWEGTLDVMVGGDAAAVARARPLLDAFARRVVETGPVGSAHTLKLLNNFVSLGYATIYAEALALGARAGVEARTFHEFLSGGRMDCGFFQTFFAAVVGGDPNAHQFTLANASKDMTYLANLALDRNMANPIGSAVRNSFATAVGLGEGDRYVPHLAEIADRIGGPRTR